MRQGSKQLAPEATAKRCEVRMFSCLLITYCCLSLLDVLQLACFGVPQGSVRIWR